MDKFTTAAQNAKTRQWLLEFMHSMPPGLPEKCQLINRPAGNFLVRMGDAADSVYMLIAGEVRIMNELPNGTIYSFAKLYAPGILGEYEVLGNFAYYRATVVCESVCTFIYLTKNDFLAWMKKSHEALFKLTVQIVTKNASQVSRDRAFLFTTGESRLAYHLAQYYEHKADQGVCELNIPRSQLADEIGFCVKTIDRCIGKFKSLGMLGRRGTKITIDAAQYKMLRNFDG